MTDKSALKVVVIGGGIFGVSTAIHLADAIKPDTEPGLDKWLQVNSEYAEKWPNITAKKEPPADAKNFDGETGKFEKYFSAEPGEGD